MGARPVHSKREAGAGPGQSRSRRKGRNGAGQEFLVFMPISELDEKLKAERFCYWSVLVGHFANQTFGCLKNSCGFFKPAFLANISHQLQNQNRMKNIEVENKKCEIANC